MKVAIVGGYGQMGQWFSEFFLRNGDKVIISGRDPSMSKKIAKKLGVNAARTNIEAVKGADFIIISVMPESLEAVVRQIAPHITKNQKIIDITSVKEQPVRIMHKYIRGADALGTHPMFGPSAKARGQNFILTPTNAREKMFAKEFGGFLKSKGFNVIETTPKLHDERVGVVLSLTHFVGFVTADTWNELEVDKFVGMSSTSFKLLKEFVKSIVDSSPELYSYLQMSVPNVPNAEEKFILKSREWAGMVKTGRRKQFMKRMRELSKYINNIE